MLFSSIGADVCWHVLEIRADGSGLRQLTPNLGDVHHYDACYLPDGGIMFSSTAFMAAVPCVNGTTRVANLYRMNADGGNIRQLCFDQEHNWCPTVLNNGRVLYQRWEYTDTPHAHARLLFSMNPDGTGQMEYYGSNSYWPNSLFYARPIPGHPTKFVAIVGGHHGVPRMGELVLFDPARGRREASADERPSSRVRIEEPFWMGRFEVTNRQYARFDPSHDSGVESRFGMQFGVRGFYVNGPGQPVVRVSWKQAMAFCRWLSERTGEKLTLPSEAQWEYACRAGTASPFFFGEVDADFSPFANLADAKLSEFVCHPYMKNRVPLGASKYDDWIPKDSRFNDGGFLSDGVGNYRPNAWGLHDVHGNVWEWTRSAYAPYPYREDDGRNRIDSDDPRVARGGSWRDRPRRARSGFRIAYRPYQPVYNVGFRVVARMEKLAGSVEP